MNNTNQNIRGWVLVAGILFLFALMTFFIIYAIRESLNSVRNSIQPVNEMTSNLGTEVAHILNPTPTILPDPITVIYQIRSLARLETIQYSVEKVITAETGPGVFEALFGDRLLFVAHGIVLAGVDLEKLGPQDMYLQDGVLYVHLPDAEIFIATLDNQKSYVYNRDTGLLRHGDVNLETTARQAAEVEIRNAAIEDGILNQASKNAENFMYRLMRDLGYPEVIFIKPTPTPAP